jgi:hypothetical protein
MITPVIEKIKIIVQTLSGVGIDLIVFYVNLFIFHASPQPFGKNIVKDPSFAVHADVNPLGQQFCGEIVAGKLGALISVENFGTAQG